MGEGEDIEGDKTIHNTLQSEYLNSSKLNLLRHVSLSIIHSHNHISSLLSTLKHLSSIHLSIYPNISHLSKYLSSIYPSIVRVGCLAFLFTICFENLKIQSWKHSSYIHQSLEVYTILLIQNFETKIFYQTFRNDSLANFSCRKKIIQSKKDILKSSKQYIYIKEIPIF